MVDFFSPGSSALVSSVRVEWMGWDEGAGYSRDVELCERYSVGDVLGEKGRRILSSGISEEEGRRGMGKKEKCVQENV